MTHCSQVAAVAPSSSLGLKESVPPAPKWFSDAIGYPHDRSVIQVLGVDIEVLQWGRRGAPGLMFIHGNGANAEWWRFVAPFFAETHHVVALSLSGNGGSGYRTAYGADIFVEEVMAAAEVAGLFDASAPPAIIGHSLGGAVAICAAAWHGRRLAGAIIIDALIDARPVWGLNRTVERWRPSQSQEEMFARFRFMPEQPCAHPFIAHFIAAAGMCRAVEPESGWIWRHDPKLLGTLDFGETWDALSDPQCPLLLVRGALSTLTATPRFEGMQARAPRGTPVVCIPEAHHHVMVDQPLALVAAIQTQLAAWQ